MGLWIVHCGLWIVEEQVRSAECEVRSEAKLPHAAFRLLRIPHSALRTLVAGILLAVFFGPGPLFAGVSIGTVEEDPNVTHEKYKKKAEDDFRDGMKARGEGDTGTAVRILLNVAEMSRMRIDSPYPEKAFNELKVIVEEARRDLAVARQLVAGEDPAAGVSELKRIVRIYMGLGPAKDAGMLLRQLDSDPKFQATLRSGRLAEDLKKAEALEAQAEALVRPPAVKIPEKQVEDSTGRDVPPEAKPAPAAPAPDPAVAARTVRELSEKERQAARIERLLDAYEIYGRIVKQGGDTEPGKKAAAARERLEKDADLMARIRFFQTERKAKELLGLADGYFRNGRMDLARQYYAKVVSDYPQTQQAADARAALERFK